MTTQTLACSWYCGTDKTTGHVHKCYGELRRKISIDCPYITVTYLLILPRSYFNVFYVVTQKLGVSQLEMYFIILPKIY